MILALAGASALDTPVAPKRAKALKQSAKGGDREE